MNSHASHVHLRFVDASIPEGSHICWIFDDQKEPASLLTPILSNSDSYASAPIWPRNHQIIERSGEQYLTKPLFITFDEIGQY